MAELGGAGDGAPDSTVTVEQLSAGDGVVTLRVAGQLDVETSPVLGELLEAAIGEQRNRLVLDVSGVDFMDSSGIAVLLVAARQASGVELRNPTRIVRRLINLTGLTEVLPLT